jgi:hypothetical protein
MAARTESGFIGLTEGTPQFEFQIAAGADIFIDRHFTYILAYRTKRVNAAT